MGRRQKKPRREFRGVEMLWNGTRWRFRARWTHRGKQSVGTVRDTQRQAFADYENARAAIAQGRRPGTPT